MATMQVKYLRWEVGVAEEGGENASVVVIFFFFTPRLWFLYILFLPFRSELPILYTPTPSPTLSALTIVNSPEFTLILSPLQQQYTSNSRLPADRESMQRRGGL